MKHLLIKNATILTMNDAMDVVSGDVLIEDGVIRACAPELTAPHAQVINFNDDYLIPGLVQTHIHLCQTLFRHEAEDRPLVDWLFERIFPLEANHHERSIRTSAELGISELLLCGTTTLLDMGTVRHGDVIAQSLAESGIRAAFGKAMMDLSDDLPEGLRETTADSIEGSLELASRYHGADNDRLRYAFAPRWALSCSAELHQEVGRLSREHGYLIHTHASEHRGEIAEVERRTGKRNIHLLNDWGMCSERSVFAHCVHLDESERRVLADTRTSVAHCPSSNLKLGSGICDTVTLLQEGINVTLGADGAPCNNSLDAMVEMRLAHLLPNLLHAPGALKASEVLRMATRGGARALGWDDRIGQISPGYDADLVRLRRDDFRLGLGSDPYTEIVTAGLRNIVHSVWVRGEELVREGELLRYDRAELLARGSMELRAVLGRAFG